MYGIEESAGDQMGNSRSRQQDAPAASRGSDTVRRVLQLSGAARPTGRRRRAASASAVVRRIVDFPPCVVVHDGELRLPTTPFGPQLSEDELLSMLRERGVFHLDGLRLVVIEPTGGLSIVREGEEVSTETATAQGDGT